MSITPIAPALPTPFADAATGETSPAAGGFAALVASLLAGAPAGTPSAALPAAASPGGPVEPAAGEPTVLGEEATTADEEAADGTPVATDAVVDPAAALAAGVLTTLPLAWQAPVATVATTTATTGPADQPGAVDATAAPSTTTVDAAPATDGSAHPGAGDEGAPSGSGSGTSPQAAVAPTTSPATQPAEPVAPAPSAPASPAAPSSVVAPPTVAAPAATADPSAARPASPVAQVVPEVTRLASQGNGVHRLTMKLQPEALGEVRVTLTVRDGAVQVRLTGGDDAARALAEGAPELRRVLELAGASEARVVVRDLAGQPAGPQPTIATPAGAQASAQGTTTDLSYGAHAGADGDAPSTGGDAGQQGQHARTRGGAGATDGLTDGATVLRPDPVSAARQGIDLTM